MLSATQCEQASMACAQAAAAYETVFMSVIPPEVIAANRAELATLVATNFLGVNTPAIGENEAEYSGMWADDATALYGYTSDAFGIASSLLPMMPSTPTVDPAGLAGQAAATGLSAGNSATNAGQEASAAGGAMSMPGGVSASTVMTMAPSFMTMVPQMLQGLTSPLSSVTGGGGMMSGLGQFQSLLSPLMGGSMMGSLMNVGGAAGNLAAPLGSLGSLPSLSGGGANLGGFAATMGRSAQLPMTKLSVPASWAPTAGATPAKLTSATPLSEAASDAAPRAGGGVPPVGAMNNNGASPAAPATTGYMPSNVAAVGYKDEHNRPADLQKAKFTNVVI
jgi:PPE-repeat protein